MKIDRMLAIITYLSSRNRVRAQELADRFEVSIRTIYRDLDAISMAGIPISSYQGANGGIGIIEGYKLDRNVLTGEEVNNIVAALKGLDSITRDTKTGLLIEKLTNIAGKSDYIPAGNEVMIDLSSWNRNDRLGSMIQEIKGAIRARRIIEFTYVRGDVSPQEYLEGKTIPLPCTRRVEPYIIVFKENTWYLYAYCLLRGDFRLFKLRRINGLRVESTVFEPRDFSADRAVWGGEPGSEDLSTIVVLFDRSLEHSIGDIFGVDNYETASDGRLKMTFRMGLSRWLFGFLLGFGDKIEVLEPAELRDRIRNMAESVCKIYGA